MARKSFYHLFSEYDFILDWTTLGKIKKNISFYGYEDLSAKGIALLCVDYNTGQWCVAKEGDKLYAFDKQVFRV